MCKPIRIKINYLFCYVEKNIQIRIQVKSSIDGTLEGQYFVQCTPLEMVRGKAFSPEDDCALSKAWIEVSQRHEEQNSPTFWSSVAEMYSSYYGVTAPQRTPDSLRSRWSVLQRLVKKYLAAERAYLSRKVSGENEVDQRENIMKLYCSRIKKQDAFGIMRDGPPLRSLGAVDVLPYCPKFGGAPSSATKGKQSTTLDLNNAEDGDEKKFGVKVNNQFSALPENSVGSKRPEGIKAAKQRLNKKSRLSGLEEMAFVMRTKTEVKKEEL